MKVDLFLAEYAHVTNDGRVNALGLGWSRVATPLPQQSVVIAFELDEGLESASTELEVWLGIFDADGVPVDFGDAPFEFEGLITIMGEPGKRPKVPQRVFNALNIQPGMPLEPGVYEYRLLVSGELKAAAKFEVVEPSQGHELAL